MARSRFGWKKQSLQFSLSAALAAAALSSACVAPAPVPGRGPDAVVSQDGVRAHLSAAESVDGGLLLISLKVPRSARGLASKEAPIAEYEGRQFPLYSVGAEDEGLWEAPLGVPFNKDPGQDRVVLWLGKPGASEKIELPFRIIPGSYRSEVLSVSGKHINPSPAEVARIKREGAEIKKLYERQTLTKHWAGHFLFPIESPVTSPFGTKRVYNGEMKSFHTGLDLKAPIGTAVRSAASGEVVLAKDLFMTGKTVILDHGYGVFTVYAHMSRLKVRPGQVVNPRQLLGLSGMTGRSSGPHLHWGAVVQKSKIDPIFLTRLMR